MTEINILNAFSASSGFMSDVFHCKQRSLKLLSGYVLTARNSIGRSTKNNIICFVYIYFFPIVIHNNFVKMNITFIGIRKSRCVMGVRLCGQQK